MKQIITGGPLFSSHPVSHENSGKGWQNLQIKKASVKIMHG